MIKVIKFVDNIDIAEGVEAMFDDDAYSSILGVDSVTAELDAPHLYADVLFTVEYDDEYATDDEIWDAIEGEFARPERIV